jgi:hypothetical protein
MAQTTEAELMRALDATEVISSLNQEVTDLEVSLTNISALMRDARFQQMIEELERRKALPRKPIELAAYQADYNIPAAFSQAYDTAAYIPTYDVRTNDSLAIMQGGKTYLVIQITDTSFCVFQRRVVEMNNSFRMSYPWVASQIRSGRIGLEFRDDPKSIRLASLAAPMMFPTAPLKGADNVQKMKVAEDYLTFIRSQCEEVKCFKRDLADSYFALERKKIPDRNLDKIIDMRQKFSSHLRTEARKCNVR